jgi:hypothetical protein
VGWPVTTSPILLGNRDPGRIGWIRGQSIEDFNPRRSHAGCILRASPTSGGAADLDLQEVEYKTCSFDNHRVTPVRINGVESSLTIDTGSSVSALARN